MQSPLNHVDIDVHDGLLKLTPKTFAVDALPKTPNQRALSAISIEMTLDTLRSNLIQTCSKLVQVFVSSQRGLQSFP